MVKPIEHSRFLYLRCYLQSGRSESFKKFLRKTSPWSLGVIFSKEAYFRIVSIIYDGVFSEKLYYFRKKLHHRCLTGSYIIQCQVYFETLRAILKGNFYFWSFGLFSGGYLKFHEIRTSWFRKIIVLMKC